jgi:hypothetical protein
MACQTEGSRNGSARLFFRRRLALWLVFEAAEPGAIERPAWSYNLWKQQSRPRLLLTADPLGGFELTEWKFAQRDAAERLAHVHHFSMLKLQAGREIEFGIRVYEYVTPMDPSMPFFAIADKQTNQAAAPYTPSGWGPTLLEAVSCCMANVRRFPYEPDAVPKA